MTDLNSLLRDYAIESGELVLPVEMSSGDALAEVMNDELEIAREPGLSAKLEHADKAEAIAEQLDVLADRAEEQAAVDQTEVSAAVAQVSAESMHREFATIMSANNLELKAASFEAAEDVNGQLVGLAKDARATSKVVTGFADNIRDLSTEGAIMQFLRQDKARLAKARTALQSAGAELTAKKGDLAKTPVLIHHDGLKKFLIVKGEPVHNAKAAIESDIQWLHKAAGAVNKAASEIGAALASAHGEGDHSAVVTKLQGIGAGLTTGLEAHLLGNHEVTGAKRSGGEKGGVNWYINYQIANFKTLPKNFAVMVGGTAVGAVVGAAVGGIAGAAVGGVGGLAAGSIKAQANTNAKHAELQAKDQASDAKSLAGMGDLQAIIKDLVALSSATDFSMDGNVEAAGEKFEGAPADVKAAGKKALSAVSKLADTVYEHAVYLTVKAAQLVSAAAAKA
jgi:hypothetical protein